VLTEFGIEGFFVIGMQSAFGKEFMMVLRGHLQVFCVSKKLLGGLKEELKPACPCFALRAAQTPLQFLPRVHNVRWQADYPANPHTAVTLGETGFVSVYLFFP